MPLDELRVLGDGVQSPETVLDALKAMSADDIDWKRGRIARFGYHADDAVAEVAERAYSMFYGHNAMAAGAFPSVARLEQEIVTTCLRLLGGAESGVGWLSSGGSESILLALKTARDEARANGQGIRSDVLMGQSAHPAFDKAAHLLGLRVVRLPLDNDYRMDPSSVANALSPTSLMIVGSAPSWPFGIVDPIECLGQLALGAGIRLHVDACVGGFFLPFLPADSARSLPGWNLSTPGVSSLSADMHKYGYSAKGASVILYGDATYGNFQTYTLPADKWPGGAYQTPTIAGTRPGGPIASAWAAMVYLGRPGYERIVEQLMSVTADFKRELESLPEIELCGDSDMSILAFRSRVSDLDLFAVADDMESLGWYCGRQVSPRSLQLALTLPHLDVTDDYFTDLKASIHRVRKSGSRSVGDARYA